MMSNRAGKKGAMLWCTIDVSKDSCCSRLSRSPGPHLRATWRRYGTIWSRNGTHRIPKLLKINLKTIKIHCYYVGISGDCFCDAMWDEERANEGHARGFKLTNYHLIKSNQIKSHFILHYGLSDGGVMHGERGVSKNLHESCNGYFRVVVLTARGPSWLLLCNTLSMGMAWIWRGWWWKCSQQFWQKWHRCWP